MSSATLDIRAIDIMNCSHSFEAFSVCREPRASSHLASRATLRGQILPYCSTEQEAGWRSEGQPGSQPGSQAGRACSKHHGRLKTPSNEWSLWYEDPLILPRTEETVAQE